jgi:murein DD-endopeptidase MepM/ murein hydrolase activator NlpD
MKKKFLKLIPFTLIMAMLLIMVSPPPPTTAQSSSASARIAALNERAAQIAAANRVNEQRLRELQNDVSRQNEFIALANTQIAEIQAQVQAYNELINAKQQAIEETLEQILIKEEEIESTERRIEQREFQIAELEEQNQESLVQFGRIAAQMYMNSGSGSLGLLSSSASFADVMLHAEMLRNIGERNTEFMEELIEAVRRQEEAITELELDIANLDNQKEQLSVQKVLFEAELAELEETKAEVAAEVERQYSVLRQLTATRNELQQNVNSIRAMSNASEAEMREINREIERIIREDEARRQRENNPAQVFPTGNFIWPLEAQFTRVTSGFGWCSWRRGQHNGTDIAQAGINNSPIFAMQSGTVTHAGPMGTYGYVVFINHGGGYTSIYAHMIKGSPTVREGQFVNQGQTIGRVGSTGRSTGPHLHLEVRRNGTPIDPMQFFRR